MELTTAKFSGHQSFPFRNTWLTKGVLGCARRPSVFKGDDALVVFGVGKNMVDSIKYWCLATRVLERDPEIKNNRGYFLRPTPLGNRLFIEHGGWDRYLEDEGTLWLLHWLLATNPKWATTAYFAFNEMTGLEFTRAGLARALFRLAARMPKVRASENTIRRDVSVFIRTYLSARHHRGRSVEDSLDCPLTELGLIYEEPTRRVYSFLRGPKYSLPDAVVPYAVWDYARQRSGQRSFTFDELAYQPLSPGRVFKLDEPALAERLERLSGLTAGAWQLTETAGYRQLLMTDGVDPVQALTDYYEHRAGDTFHES